MKKFSAFIIIALLTVSAAFGVGAASGEYSWYCAHKKGHVQPKCDTTLSFIEQYDGFYIDKKHGDDCADKVIYLTFDAGYENGNVEKILDVLHKEQVGGAFFVLGNLIKQNPELIQRMFDEGHLVCNHTFCHDPMIGKNKDEINRELSRLESCCKELTGKEMHKYYRPPEGRFNEEVLKTIQELGYKTVFWSFAYDDWDNNRQQNEEAAKKKILDNIHNGEIMLLHPTSSTNASILGDVIKALKAEGFRFGTLDELCHNEILQES